MTTSFEIPLGPNSQSFNVQLAGLTYDMRILWNDAEQAWSLDISDSSGNPLVSGIPLVTGVDLLAQYEYIGIGGQLFASTDNDPTAPPTFANLGSTGHLYFVTDP